MPEAGEHELTGGALDDPDARFELELVLRSG
jgi:hypothetical protein